MKITSIENIMKRRMKLQYGVKLLISVLKNTLALVYSTGHCYSNLLKFRYNSFV